MNNYEINIRETNSEDFFEIMEVEKLAFGSDDEAKLVADLFSDKSAEPNLSLLAFYKKEAIGHILFTRAYIEDNQKPLIHLLAPLAVKPEFQNKGIGGLLIREGLNLLKQRGSELIFVLGHKTYYPKHGFLPFAEKQGFPAPYPIPEKDADAWMVLSLTENGLDDHSGTIRCADKIMKPQYWRE